ncbi:MAG TPA: aminoacyl-histidine dipeptidase, partial [Ferruginibacter sp.]|nr:aminoacyl-histidine dipeptidase [Ferruginibacter sp.]
MSDLIRQLEPTALWNHFADLNAVPRPSKKEERVIAFIKSFGEKLQLSTYVDEAGNVIIKKPASKGMENKTTVVLQSHLDMVHQKNADTVFDFDKEGIQMLIEGDWIKAKGTTLGADNGIGVASIMTLLASTDIPHPALEALFTIDEETGMTGALALKGGLLDGSIMLNLDTEEDNELTIGCAGGIDVTASGNYSPEGVQNGKAFRITLKGLAGGHSGVDIHKGKANANKLMNRILLKLTTDGAIKIAAIIGGSLRNAIPRESVATIMVPSENEAIVKKITDEYQAILKAEYSFTDPNLALSIEAAENVTDVMPAAFQQSFLRAMYACPNGIYRMSPDIEGLVQISNNIAKVELKDGQWTVQCLTRSSVDTEKTDLAQSISSAFELTGGSIKFGGNYPGWEPKPGSPIVKLMSDLYKEMFNEPA